MPDNREKEEGKKGSNTQRPTFPTRGPWTRTRVRLPFGASSLFSSFSLPRSCAAVGLSTMMSSAERFLRLLPWCLSSVSCSSSLLLLKVLASMLLLGGWSVEVLELAASSALTKEDRSTGRVAFDARALDNIQHLRRQLRLALRTVA